MVKVVSRFQELITQTQEFLESRNEEYEQLTDPCWLLDLPLLTYLTLELYLLNLKFQGKYRRSAEMTTSVRAFTDKLTLRICDIRKRALLNFPLLKTDTSEAGSEENFEPRPCAGHLGNLQE
jgi:hypothetical protein